MDPDATLALMRAALKQYGSALDDQVAIDAADEFAGHFANLDKWLSKGGFLPKEWDR